LLVRARELAGAAYDHTQQNSDFSLSINDFSLRHEKFLIFFPLGLAPPPLSRSKNYAGLCRTAWD
jgi:hypothetical protein